MRARRAVICISDLHQNDTRIGCPLSGSTANNRPLGPRHGTMARLWYDSSRFLLQGGECCVCSISPSSLLRPSCLGLLFASASEMTCCVSGGALNSTHSHSLLFARLLRQVELSQRSANAKAGRLRQSSSLYSHSMAKAFIASPAETGRRSPAAVINASILVVLSRHWAGPSPAWLHPTISWYTGIRYRDTIFSHDTSPNFNLTKLNTFG